MMMRGHLKHMAIGGGVLAVVLLAFGVPISSALPYALILACPLMMIGMMLMMRGDKHQGHAGCGHDQHDTHPDHAEDKVNRPRWSEPAEETRPGVSHPGTGQR